MKTLEGPRVAASSVLKPEGRYAYDAEAVLDNGKNKDGMTRDAWCEGVDGPGLGEWIELRPAEPVRLSCVDVVPGYVDNNPREVTAKFTSNSRPAKMEMIVNDSYKRMIEFEDWPTGRTISLEGYSKPVSSIRFVIREVYPGTRYQDTCISSIKWSHLAAIAGSLDCHIAS